LLKGRINNTLLSWNEVIWEPMTHQYAGWFWCDLIPVYWCVIDSHGTSFQHTDVFLILMWPHYSILMCYWSSWYFIPADLCAIDSHVAIFQHYCWFSCDLIPAYQYAIDSHVTLFQRTEELLILMWSHSSILMCYWFSCDLIPA
jgi:hypothetical protein